MLISPFKSSAPSTQPPQRSNGSASAAFFNFLFLNYLQPLALTGGGRTLQMPVFSAMGRILLIKAYGSRNSSQLGSKTGHSGGGLNSSGRGRLMVSAGTGRLKRRSYQKKKKKRERRCCGPVRVCPFFSLSLSPVNGSLLCRETQLRSVAIHTGGGCTQTHTH